MTAYGKHINRLMRDIENYLAFIAIVRAAPIAVGHRRENWRR